MSYTIDYQNLRYIRFDLDELFNANERKNVTASHSLSDGDDTHVLFHSKFYLEQQDRPVFTATVDFEKERLVSMLTECVESETKKTIEDFDCIQEMKDFLYSQYKESTNDFIFPANTSLCFNDGIGVILSPSGDFRAIYFDLLISSKNKKYTFSMSDFYSPIYSDIPSGSTFFYYFPDTKRIIQIVPSVTQIHQEMTSDSPIVFDFPYAFYFSDYPWSEEKHTLITELASMQNQHLELQENELYFEKRYNLFQDSKETMRTKETAKKYSEIEI